MIAGPIKVRLVHDASHGTWSAHAIVDGRAIASVHGMLFYHSAWSRVFLVGTQFAPLVTGSRS